MVHDDKHVYHRCYTYAIKTKPDVVNLSLGMQIWDGNLIYPFKEQKHINSSAKDEEEFWNDLFNHANEKKRDLCPSSW
jgi:hypothetical protein